MMNDERKEDNVTRRIARDASKQEIELTEVREPAYRRIQRHQDWTLRTCCRARGCRMGSNVGMVNRRKTDAE